MFPSPDSLSAMAPKRKPAAGKATPKLAAHNFLPMLTKPAEVIGDYVSLQSKEWTGCPAADKEIRSGSGLQVHRARVRRRARFLCIQVRGSELLTDPPPTLESRVCLRAVVGSILLGWFSVALFLRVGCVLNPTVDPVQVIMNRNHTHE